ncbi:hypothetical protein BDV98DRAFT_599803 [Pterulicium gracile]|uniref:Uncharacterized protein n=1 Tax=Pterulicium gracile TaxID=1884261 RepID=A0A5C3R1L3_9AGAR|nr:hypothetical protein BDV98DRAFT_599803 [Pterula gracilis]
MVSFSLLANKANLVSSRYFPYTGLLGLTPINIDGVVKSKLDADAKPLPAISIQVSVKCYEHIVGKVGNIASNVVVDHTQTLWTKPDGVEYDLVSDLELPFHITLPADVGGFSTLSLVEYKCVWRIEAVITHLPITGVGSRILRHFELPFIRHSLPPPPPPPMFPSLLVTIPDASVPPIRCAVELPNYHIGPLDMAPVILRIYPSVDALVVKAASMVIERRLILHHPSRSNNSSESQSQASSSTLALTEPSSAATSTSDLATLTAHPSPAPYSVDTLDKCVVAPIVSTESTGAFTYDQNGSWTKTLTVQWPPLPSSTRWAVGETINSVLGSVRFFVRIKVAAYLPSGSVSFDLPEQEISIVTTNDAQRQSAMTKYEEQLASTSRRQHRSRSKSKSPGLRRQRSNESRPSEAARTHPSSPLPKPPAAKKSSRRPHTSAGPRDQKPFPPDDRLLPREKTASSSSLTTRGQIVHPDGSTRPSTGIACSDPSRFPIDPPLSSPFRPVQTTQYGGNVWDDQLRRHAERKSRRGSDFFTSLFRRKASPPESRPRTANVQGVLS